jgi:hypothetical protein
MVFKSTGNNSASLGERVRALRILRRTIEDLSKEIEILDHSEYDQSEHWRWRCWTELSTENSSPAPPQPATAMAIFKRETENDIIIYVQVNHHCGATWTEIPMLPLAILFLRLWRFRLCEKDADRIFRIVDDEGRHEAIDYLTSRQFSHWIMLVVITMSHAVGRAMYDSLSGLINQEIKPSS